MPYSVPHLSNPLGYKKSPRFSFRLFRLANWPRAWNIPISPVPDTHNHAVSVTPNSGPGGLQRLNPREENDSEDGTERGCVMRTLASRIGTKSRAEAGTSSPAVPARWGRSLLPTCQIARKVHSTRAESYVINQGPNSSRLPH